MQLGTQFASLLMDGIGQGFVEVKPFFMIQGRTEAVGEHGNIADDDHGAAPCGDLFQPFHQLLLGQP